MASPTEIRKGRAILYQGTPHIVLEMQHRTQGRQAGFVQTTLRSLQSGATTTTKFRSTDNVEFLHTTTIKLEYSYKDNDGFHFMDLETYEDTVLSEDMIGEDEIFLVEGNNYDILLVDDKQFDWTCLPPWKQRWLKHRMLSVGTLRGMYKNQ